MTLEEKINLSRERIAGFCASVPADKIAVAWTGGKDSTVALSLFCQECRQSGQRPQAINVDTGVKFPDVLAFRDNIARKWQVDLYISKPEKQLYSKTIAQDVRQCCQDLKIIPLKNALSRLQIEILLTGVRGDEHAQRQTRDWQERRFQPDYLMVHPLLHWTEMDIWSFIWQEELPYCELYNQGYRSLGCKPCTSLPTGNAERSGRRQEKENQMEQLHSLGYF